MFEDKIEEARNNYQRACDHHAEMAELHRAGVITGDDLMEAIEDMRQAQEELEEVRNKYC